MASLIRGTRPAHQPVPRGLLIIGAFAIALCAIFLVLPGDLARKTHLALHGICAQRPSHSLRLGGDTLPLDARMSGIYLGALTSGIWLMAAGRLRATGNIHRPVLAIIALFVVVMAVDGINGLLVDLKLPYSYEPSNVLRMATGVLAGTSLGLGLGYLFAVSMWTNVERQRPLVTRPAELACPVAVAGAFGALALSGLPSLYAPFAVGLVMAALAVFWQLGMVLLALTTGRAWGHRSYSDMTRLALASAVGAVVALALMSALRLAAEQYLGLPQLT